MFVSCIQDLPTFFEDTQATWVATIVPMDAFETEAKRKATVDLEYHGYIDRILAFCV